MIAFIGPWEALIFFLVILLVFGSTRFVGAARGLGRGAREFKRSITGEDEKPKATLPPSEREDPV